MKTPDTAEKRTETQLADEARALLAATSEVAGEQVSEARKRLTAVLESSQKALIKVKDQVVKGAKATDEAVHKHPYLAIGVAVGVGALIGFLAARRYSRRND